MRRRKFVKQLGVGVASVVVGAPILAEVVSTPVDFIKQYPLTPQEAFPTGFTQEMWDQLEVLYVFDENQFPPINWKTRSLEEFNNRKLK